MRRFGSCRHLVLRDRNRGEPGKWSRRDVANDAKDDHHSDDQERVGLPPLKGERLHPVWIDPGQPGPARPESEKGETDDKKFILPECSAGISVEEGPGRTRVSTTRAVQSGECVKTAAG